MALACSLDTAEVCLTTADALLRYSQVDSQLQRGASQLQLMCVPDAAVVRYQLQPVCFQLQRMCFQRQLTCFSATDAVLASYSRSASQLPLRCVFELRRRCVWVTGEVLLSKNCGAFEQHPRCFSSTAEVLLTYMGCASEQQRGDSHPQLVWFELQKSCV